MTQLPGESPEAARARRKRSIVMAFGLAAFVVLVFVVTIIRLSQNAPVRHF